MEKIVEFNDYALAELRKLNNTNEISNPLLLSAKARGKIMYTGQKTNDQFESLRVSNYNAREFEDFYERYFLNGKVRNTLFWRFIKDIIEIDDLASTIVWTNTLVVVKIGALDVLRLIVKLKIYLLKIQLQYMSVLILKR